MTDENYEMSVHKIPTLDTGIGRALGYESDAALTEDAELDRATWQTETREAVEKYEAGFMRRVMFGEDAS